MRRMPWRRNSRWVNEKMTAVFRLRFLFPKECKAYLTYQATCCNIMHVKQALLLLHVGDARQEGGKPVHNRIEAIRKERGIRQEDFARAMGVSRQTISSLETGRYNPSILLAYKIAKYFDMTIEEVFLFEEER